jgi:hypothetical protein
MGHVDIGIPVQCHDGKYFGAIRAPRNVYNHVLEFLKRNHGRKLREVVDAGIDISDLFNSFDGKYLARYFREAFTGSKIRQICATSRAIPVSPSNKFLRISGA